jgi:predicted nuclease with TOPRIM domain
MIRLEQVRGELLERLERLDRRVASSDQRLARIEQQLSDLNDQIDVLHTELVSQLELLSLTTADFAEPADH